MGLCRGRVYELYRKLGSGGSSLPRMEGCRGWRPHNAEVSAIFVGTRVPRLLVQPFLQRCPFGGFLGHEGRDALGQQRVGIYRSGVGRGLGEI